MVRPRIAFIGTILGRLGAEMISELHRQQIRRPSILVRGVITSCYLLSWVQLVHSLLGS